MSTLKKVFLYLLIMSIISSMFVITPVYGQEITIISTSFEGETGGFVGRPGNTGGTVADIAISTEQAHTGSSSLKVTNRTKNWGGPTLDLTPTLTYGRSYDISVWVYIPSGTKEMGVSLEIKMADGRVTFPWVGGDTQSVASGSWVEFAGNYKHTYVGELDYIRLNVQSNEVGSFTDFYIDDFSLTELEEISLATLPSLKDEYADCFYIGGTYSNKCLTGADREMVLRQYNVLTAENMMKPENILGGQNADGSLIFNWADCDSFVDFCTENNIEIVGHTLIWGDQTPEYMTEGTADEVKARMKEYIEAVMGRYKGRIKYWDVVNEALNPTTSGYRSNIWSKSELGTDYVYWAYKYATDWALANDPDVQLLYNDYNETQSSKLQGMYDLVYDLKVNKGLKIDGIGLQAHYYLNNYADRVVNVRTAIDKLSSIPGIKLHISELDVCVSDEYTLADQAQRYADLMRLFCEKKDVIERVSFWCYDDGNSWRAAYYPTLFNADYTPKEAFWACASYSRHEFNKTPVESSSFLTHYAAKGSPVVDGGLDNEWRFAKELNVGGNRVKVMWDDDFLYIIADGDDVAVYLNEDGKRTGALRAGDSSYHVAEGNVTFSGDCDKTNFAYGQHEGITEMAIPFRLSHMQGDRLGFDIVVNGNNWNSTATDLESNTESYGSLILISSASQSTQHHKKTSYDYSLNSEVISNIITDDFTTLSGDYKVYNDTVDTSALTATSGVIDNGRLMVTGEGIQIRLDTSYDEGTQLQISADITCEGDGQVESFVKIMRGTSNLKYVYLENRSVSNGEAIHLNGIVTIPAPGFTPKDTFLIINSTSPVWYLDNLKVDKVTSADSGVTLWADPLTSNTVTDDIYTLLKDDANGSLTYNGGWKSLVYSANGNDHVLDRGFKVLLPTENLKYGDIAEIYADIRDNYANAITTIYFQLESNGRLVQNTLLYTGDRPEKYATGTRLYLSTPVIASDFDKAYLICKFSEGSGGSVIMRDIRFTKKTPVAPVFVNKGEEYTPDGAVVPNYSPVILHHSFAQKDGWYTAGKYSGGTYDKSTKTLTVSDSAALDLTGIITEGHSYIASQGNVTEGILTLPAGEYTEITVTEAVTEFEPLPLSEVSSTAMLPKQVTIGEITYPVVWKATELDRVTCYGVIGNISENAYVYTAKLVPAQEIVITEAKADGNDLSIVISSTYKQPKEVYLIAAVYCNENTLYSLDIKKVTAEYGVPVGDVLTIATPESEYTIKAFAWDENLSPYAEGKNINE